MSFPTVDLFTRVETLGSWLASHLNRLTIDTARRRRRGPSLALALALCEHGVDLLPDPLLSPAIEVAIDRRSSAETRRQLSPLAASFRHLKHSVEHLTQRQQAATLSTRLPTRFGQQPLKKMPLPIRHVCWILILRTHHGPSGSGFFADT